MFNPFQTNPSPLAAQQLQRLARPLAPPVAPIAPVLRNPALARPLTPPTMPTLPTNASPRAQQQLAMLGAAKASSPMPMQQPPNPALQAQRAAMPRGFGTVIR